MTPERAQEIVSAINARCLVTMGIEQPMARLEGVSLAEMLEAKDIVKAQNETAKSQARDHGGGYSIQMVPDDRLIAAVYVIGHYHPSRDPILYLPARGLFSDRIALAVVGMSSDDEEQVEEEGA